MRTEDLRFFIAMAIATVRSPGAIGPAPIDFKNLLEKSIYVSENWVKCRSTSAKNKDIANNLLKGFLSGMYIDLLIGAIHNKWYYCRS